VFEVENNKLKLEVENKARKFEAENNKLKLDPEKFKDEAEANIALDNFKLEAMAVIEKGRLTKENEF